MFGAYTAWNDLYASYGSAKKQPPSVERTIQLKQLRVQIVKQYFKTFFYFPVLAVKFLTPSYMKGPVTVWDNLKTLFRTLASREFRPLRHAILSQIFFLYAVGQLGFLLMHNYAVPALAATYGWTMTDWSGGASTTLFAAHPDNQDGWNYFYSKDTSIDTGTEGQVGLLIAITTTTDTTDADFNAGAKTNVYVPSGSNSFRLLKQEGATCSSGAECRSGSCNGSNKCYIP